MNFRMEENESISVHASDPLLETERKKIVVKYKCPFCRHVMAVREAQHAEHGQLLCPKCVTRATRRNGARFSAACDNELPVSEAQALLFADDGACNEVSSFAEEANLPPDSTAVRDQLQLIEPCAGDEALNVFYPIQVENLLSDQRVETPELPTYQQGDCALHNGLSSPTPEPAVQDAPPPADSLVGYPVQESDQDVRGSYLVQETSGLRLLRGYDQSRCQQQTNDFQINGVSSLGENDQAIQQSCTMQEMRLWKKEITKAKTQKATKGMNARDAFFIAEITEVSQHRYVDANGGTTAVFTCPIKTDRYGYKLGLRIYLNGVGDGRDRFVAIFVHVMMGKYDNFQVRWPFTQRITLSIIDQSGAERHLSQILQAQPDMIAFQKPTEVISRTGCGFVNFASIEEVFSHAYVKDDKLFLKIEFSP